MSAAIEIKGLNIKPNKDELEIIGFKQLIEQKIAPGHLLYFPANSERAFLMLRAGEFVDQTWIDKYREKGLSTFYSYNIVNNDIVQKGMSLFTKLENAKLEEEHFYARNQILAWFHDYYWLSGKNSSILDLTLTCYKCFSKLDEKIVNSFKDTSILLYNRAHQIASLSTILALVFGYMDFNFLRDIYHASFLLDYGLMENKFTYNVSKACEQECINPHTGKNFLLNRVKDGPEYQTFFNHCELGYLKAIRDCKDIANSLDVFGLIRRHHEMADGQGFPYKLHSGVLAEWELIPIFLDHAVPYVSQEYERNDGGRLLQRFTEELLKKENVKFLPTFRLVQKIKLFFETEIGTLRAMEDQSIGETYETEAEIKENEVI